MFVVFVFVCGRDYCCMKSCCGRRKGKAKIMFRKCNVVLCGGLIMLSFVDCFVIKTLERLRKLSITCMGL